MRYYHGSRKPLDAGLRLRPGRGTGETHPELDALLDAWRPEGTIPRGEAVYLVADPDDVDAAGGHTDHLYEVEPEGAAERSDLAWYSQAQTHLCDGNLEAAAACARAYWSGEPFPDRGSSLFEYRARAAVVVRDLDEEAVPGAAFR